MNMIVKIDIMTFYSGEGGRGSLPTAATMIYRLLILTIVRCDAKFSRIKIKNLRGKKNLTGV